MNGHYQVIKVKFGATAVGLNPGGGSVIGTLGLGLVSGLIDGIVGAELGCTEVVDFALGASVPLVPQTKSGELA